MGRPYRVGDDGRKLMFGSPRPAGMDPESWRSLSRKKRDDFKSSLEKKKEAERMKKKFSEDFDKELEKVISKEKKVKPSGDSPAKPKPSLKEKKKKAEKESKFEIRKR